MMTFEEILKSMTFEESMKKCNTLPDSSEKWPALEKAYNDYYLANIGNPLPSKIPKILHQIWLGGPFPDKYKILTDLWKSRHPDWTVLLWTEAEIEEFGLVNKRLYDDIKNPSAKSDVVRYEIAYSYGGVYVDTDFYSCRSLDDLLYLDFFCGICGSYDGKIVSPETCIAASIFACSQGNKFVENIINTISQTKATPRSIEEIMAAGPQMFSQKAGELLPQHPMSVVFPPNYFFPFPGQRRHSIRNMQFHDMQYELTPFIYPETYAMHLWYCSWQKQNLL